MMKLSISSTILILIAIFSGATHAVTTQESGADCNISAEVDCRLTDGTNRICKALQNQPYDQCGIITVHWTYTYCNHNTQKMYFHQNLFEPLLHNVDVTKARDINGSLNGFDKSEMNANQCRDITIPKVINTCDKRNTVASLKLEGNLSNKSNGGGNYCFAWAFSKQKIGMPPNSGGPINPPQPPIPAPVNNIPANISMSISCKYESNRGSNVYDRDCSGIQSIMDLHTNNKCVIPVEYSYIVVNLSSTDKAKVLAIIDEKTNNIARELKTLSPFDRSVTLIRSTIDICANKGMPVEKKAVALAASVPAGIPGSATASLTIATPTIISDWDLVNIGCRYNGLPCSSSVYCIKGEVDFTYRIQNVGSICNDVEKVTVNFGAATTRVLSIAGDHGRCTEREFCPGDEWELKESRYVDTCSNSYDYRIVLGIYVIHGTTTSFGNWSGPSAIAPAPSPPVPSPSAPTPTPPVCTTTATKLIFMYHGGHSCRFGHARKRNLRKRSNESKRERSKTNPSSSSSSSSWTYSSSSSSSHSSTTITTSTTTSSMTIISHSSTTFCDCNDFAMTSTNELVSIEVMSKNEKQFYGHHDSHRHGNPFTVISANGSTPLKNNITVKIYDMHGAVVQTINVNTGGQCLEDIINKPMGSLTLIGWE